MFISIMLRHSGNPTLVLQSLLINEILIILWPLNQGFFFFLMLSCMRYIYICVCMCTHTYIYVLDINSLLVISFINIFSHSVGCPNEIIKK